MCANFCEANVFTTVIRSHLRCDLPKFGRLHFAAAVEPAIYAVATDASTEASHLAVAIVDEDHSDLSRRIRDGLTPPTFQPALEIAASAA